MLDQLADWICGQIVGFLGNFFALMGNMGVELLELNWVNAIVLFFFRLGWTLFAVSVVVCAVECGIECPTDRGNLQQCALKLYDCSVSVSRKISKFFRRRRLPKEVSEWFVVRLVSKLKRLRA